MTGGAGRGVEERATARGIGFPVLLLVLVLAVAGCQRVGVERDGTPTPTSPPVALPGAGEVTHPAAPETLRPITVPREEVSGIDPILHSPVANDPRFQEQVAFWIDFWTSRGSASFGRYLERMGLYDGFVDLELERRGLPASLRYLPIVESGYHHGVVSRVGATGLWQIMAPTARELGLSVGSIVDDRRDPVAATRAALDYLEQLHARFDSWFLALSAYNAGPGRVGQIVARHDPDGALSGDERFLVARAGFPAETREFVPKLFAAAELARNPERYGFEGVVRLPSMAFEEVLVPDATSLDVVAEAAEVEHDEILSLNPHFLRGFTPRGEVRTVRVPPGVAERFERNYALIPADERLTFLEHVVSSGETFSHIARLYGVAVADLTGANGNIDPRRLQIGARLVVPVAGRRPASTTLAQAPASSVGGGSSNLIDAGDAVRYHQVRAGESWGVIARRYGVGVDALARANNRTRSDIIRAGEELRIP